MIQPGVDIIKIDRIQKILNSDKGSVFCGRVYSTLEIDQAEKRSNSTLYYANRFAAKEAVIKALTPIMQEVDLREIEILSLDTGQPVVMLHGSMLAYAESRGVKGVTISLSDDEDYAIAFAIVEIHSC